MSFKVGLGYDIHRFGKGRKLVLGGVEIPDEEGLEGHSDADVILHAVCDAVLGALGLGDIGEHFPNTDEKFKGVSSVLLLEEVMHLCQNEGYEVNNMDIAVQAEKPHLKKYKDQMRERIARVLKVPVKSVNIKATTQEGLGAIGRSEGIAAFAVVSLVKFE